ncbi:Nuclear elongation and deformation protein 1 [Neolecta irregularis DAH-3]|uniref:Nuclear elongation and deformation protein 1 n=1 Tax=Neolecta irregularis (strain DAH-3) TaxID=1198029 RepID=A0A1U7LKK1_NEOID|nr:Nuclear elongation and deformation protein 1 [Neolecta irregularis DAH-3]|eukprot:OLL23123.1 Nuclear elongation and deformation protein 1 [Neolecta irregularis DAH-3]
MQYVGRAFGSVSRTWNSINPATLSGAIDVIVVERENGDLVCSPFHVRFGKFSTFRPSEKKVEFRINGDKTDFAMKLGEGGEAFFVFETDRAVPQELQTSPVLSPTTSPLAPGTVWPAPFQEPDFLDLDRASASSEATLTATKCNEAYVSVKAASDTNVPQSQPIDIKGSVSREWSITPNSPTSHSDNWSLENEHRPLGRASSMDWVSHHLKVESDRRPSASRSSSAPRLADTRTILERAHIISEKLNITNIPTHIMDNGDVMLDMHGYKSTHEDEIHAALKARDILAAELKGDIDIESLIEADRDGNLWIYASEGAKEAAAQKSRELSPEPGSAPGLRNYSNDSIPFLSSSPESEPSLHHSKSEPTLQISSYSDPNRNYAKTLRLTSDQLKSLNLKDGPNPMSFSVNQGRSICTAHMYFWKWNVPVVISDIDGTITNRSVGQADTTRNYLKTIEQAKYKIPEGPVLMSPDRTMAALRREMILKKPEVFKMACLQDIQYLYGENVNPFYAGFGNRIADAVSYRSAGVPSSRIFTINSYAEVRMELLELAGYRSSYIYMTDLVDHFFPPVGFAQSGEYTDAIFWKESLPEVEFSESSEVDEDVGSDGSEGEEEGGEDEDGDFE